MNADHAITVRIGALASGQPVRGAIGYDHVARTYTLDEVITMFEDIEVRASLDGVALLDIDAANIPPATWPVLRRLVASGVVEELDAFARAWCGARNKVTAD